MSSQNKIILIGETTKEPDVKMSTSGQPVANFMLAVERPSVGDTPPVKDFIPVVAWRENAELLENCGANTTLLIEGRIQTRNYETNEGVRKYVTEVDARVVRIIGANSASNQSTTSPAASVGVEPGETAPQYNFVGTPEPASEPVPEPQESFPQSLEEKPVVNATEDSFDFEDPFSADSDDASTSSVSAGDSVEETEENIPF